mmetsp:Transcript_159030/g.506493  ORF Transcript_159030/g.506493 Transcript_159030/m.506493 type:complete len:479 (+) Transcript_159030:80-1516(+)
MGLETSKPSDEDREFLTSTLEQTCRIVAEDLSNADVLLVCFGAGFSADSGLALYKDIAELEAYRGMKLQYHDICQPLWLHKDPELFYGFWGTCYNDYRDTQPHEGYDILRRWKDELRRGAGTEIRAQLGAGLQEQVALDCAWRNAGNVVDVDADAGDAPPSGQPPVSSPYTVEGFAGAFYIYTSNVDAHSFDYFEPAEVRECHGNTEVWQCGAEPQPCCRQIWRAPLDFRFNVGPLDMRAPRNPKALPTRATDFQVQAVGELTATEGTDGVSCAGRVRRPYGRRAAPLVRLPVQRQAARGDEKGGPFRENWPRCPACDGLARPAILMFNDNLWIDDDQQEIRWIAWKRAVRAVAGRSRAEGRRSRVLILEIGCGANVTTVRTSVERAARQFAEEATVTVARVNPDFCLPDKLALPSEHHRRPPSRATPPHRCLGYTQALVLAMWRLGCSEAHRGALPGRLARPSRKCRRGASESAGCR